MFSSTKYHGLIILKCAVEIGWVWENIPLLTSAMHDTWASYSGSGGCYQLKIIWILVSLFMEKEALKTKTHSGF